jgi:hypothetical protein
MSKCIYPEVSLRNHVVAFALLLLLGCFAQLSAQWTMPDGNQNISNTNIPEVGIERTSPNALLEVKKSKNAGTKRIFDNPFTTFRNSTPGIGTTRPTPKLAMFDNFLAGNITGYTLLYPGYDTQSNVIMELGYGTATSNVVLMMATNTSEAGKRTLMGIQTVVIITSGFSQ